MIRALAVSFPAIVLLAAPLPAAAAGPYDGTWQVDAPAAIQTTRPQQPRNCQPLRLRFTVNDNEIHGSHTRSPDAPKGVIKGPAAPIVGHVQQDGVVNATWQDLKVTGKLTGDKAELRWRGACGQRVAMGGRITSGAGSSTEKR